MPKTRAYIAWIVVCLVWGTTYLAIRVAIDSLPPLLMAGFRWSIAGTILLVFFRMRRERLPGYRAWPSLAVRGVLLIGFGNGAVVWAQQIVPSGLASVLVAVAAFWMVGVEALFKDGDRVTFRQWLGLSVGFGGVLLLIWPRLGFDITDRAFMAGVAATQLACAGWALGSSYARRARRQPNPEPTLTAPACEMLFGGIALLFGGLVSGEQVILQPTARSLIAFFYLIVFGSILAFTAYRYAIQHLPVATVSLYVYVNTVLAMILGTVVLGEPYTWRMGAGAAIVLTGIALVKDDG